MNTFRNVFLLVNFLLGFANSFAAETKVSVPMDYRLVRNVLISQLYIGEGETARLWKDGKECSFLDVSNPKIGAEKGQVKIENNIHARIGMALGGKCMPAVEWKGMLQTFQKPTLDSTGNVLSFPVTRAIAYDQNGQPLNIPQLQELINQAVQPKLAALKIDLNESRADISKTLLPFIDADETETLHDTLNSLRFNRVDVGDKALLINVGFSGFKNKKSTIEPVQAFSADELQQWQHIWQNLEQSLESNLNKPPLDNQSLADKETLRDVLQEAGVAFEQGLTTEDIGKKDPVREFFNKSWDKMGPLLRTVSNQLPGAEGLRYITLIAATDLMYEIEAVTKPLGLEISANGLRKLARSYLAHQVVNKS